VKYKFIAKGHANILGTHATTFEFTKESELTKKGDCILGVESDFELNRLRKFLGAERVRITITAGQQADVVTAKPNRNFSDIEEMVVRLGGFDSGRTFGLDADKACRHLKRGLIQAMKTPGERIEVTIESL